MNANAREYSAARGEEEAGLTQRREERQDCKRSAANPAQTKCAGNGTDLG